MKNYIQFLNEVTHYLDNISISNDFEFIIDITNCTEEEIKKAFEEFEKYTKIDNWTKKYLVTKDANAKPWAWRISIRFNWRKSCIDFGIITTRGWGIGDGNIVDDRITLKEFLEVGLEGVKDYIKKGNMYHKVLYAAEIEKQLLKNKIEKYNL